MDMQDLDQMGEPNCVSRANVRANMMRRGIFWSRTPVRLVAVHKINAITGRCKGRADSMTTITDDFMRQMMARTKEYCVVILKTAEPAQRERHEDYLGTREAECRLREGDYRRPSAPLRMAAT